MSDRVSPLAGESRPHPHSPLAWARSYAARGWLVFPVHTVEDDRCSCGRPDCSSPGKHPRTRQGLKDGTTDPDQIASWWQRWPSANIGIVTGVESGLVVLDVDVDQAGDETLRLLESEHGLLPTTVTAQTGGGGQHYLFSHPGGQVRNSAGKLGPGLDVRGDGGYIVAPPSQHASGDTYQWLLPPEETALAQPPSWLLQPSGKQADAAVVSIKPAGRETIVEGERNARLTSIAGSLRRQGLDEAALVATLDSVNALRVRPPLPRSELEAIAASVARYPVEPKSYRLTDYGNAERLVDRHGNDLRFVSGIGWHVWDGQRWQPDGNGEVMRRMKETIRSVWEQLPQIKDDRVELARFLAGSESATRLKAALSLAESEAAVVVSVEQLDADPYLLTVANGTVDLRTGMLREHRREDLITKLAPVHYDLQAKSPLWDGFLARVTGGDEELQAFLQRAVGYSLTGLTSEEVLFFTHGPAASGKSSFLEAIKAVFGDYATTADFETFLKKPGGGGVRNDIARLAGARLVVGTEVDEGRELAEGLVKQLTGGDKISARFLYKEHFEFDPQFTLWLGANDRPSVRASDSGIWRRILQVPFTEAIPEDERDPTLKSRFKHDPEVQSAILAWAVQGALDWQEHGLGVPERVRSYTEEYRAEVDPLTDFLAEHTILDPHGRTERGATYRRYEQWAHSYGAPPLKPKAFAEALKRHGITDGGKSGNSRYWSGLTLQPHDDPATTDAY